MTSTTSTLKLDRSQLSKVAKGDPEVVRQLEALIARVNALVSSGGGSGAVESVNGETGVVVLDAGDVGADASGTAAALVGAHAALTVGAHGMTALGAAIVSSATAADARDELGLSALAVGGLSPATITVPFGAQEQTVTIVDANCTAASKVIVGWGSTAATDENQPTDCAVTFSAVPAAGSLAVTVSSDNADPVGGTYKILYTLG